MIVEVIKQTENYTTLPDREVNDQNEA